MPLLALSTVGTSLLTNGASAELKALLNRTANLVCDEIAHPDREQIDERAAAVRACLAGADRKQLQAASAELNGLLRYEQATGTGLQANDVHVLVRTDTYACQQSAALVECALRHLGVRAVLVPEFKRLSTRDRWHFSQGISEVIAWCEETLPRYRQRGYRIVFNLTGGFKALQGYMNTLGMLHADELVYLFEPPNEELIIIPRLPVSLETADTVKRHAQVLARLAAHEALPLAEVQQVPTSLLEEYQGEAALSPWGKLVWQRERKAALAGELLNWPFLEYGPDFARDFARLDQEGRVAVQEALVRAAVLLGPSGGRDVAPLRREGGLLYEDYRQWPGIAHFRASQAHRVSCQHTGAGLLLRRCGREPVVNRKP